jgi:hypothetical protein
MMETMREVLAKLAIAKKLTAEVKDVVALVEGRDSCFCMLVSLADNALGSAMNSMGELKC